jgi:hypothetical protein
MQVRPTIMASALLQAAIRNAASTDAAKKIINHASCDNPAKPFATGYNRAIVSNIRVSQATLSHLYKE